jgi:Phosphopantetheine attachment site/AMP-binding enzyme C-terminal domain
VPRRPGAARGLCSLPLPSPEDQRPLTAYANAPAEPSRRQHLAEALRQHLRTKLPDYMIPASFVWLDALPLTPHGKLNRRALPTPDTERLEPAGAYTPPETPLHQQIVTVWNEVLGFSGFGIDANFFNIGGHSLLATQVVSRLADLVDVDIPLRLMFERPTIRGFAEAVAALQTQGDARAIPPVVPIRPADPAAADVAGLSDNEVDRLLAKLLAEGGAG